MGFWGEGFVNDEVSRKFRFLLSDRWMFLGFSVCSFPHRSFLDFAALTCGCVCFSLNLGFKCERFGFFLLISALVRKRDCKVGCFTDLTAIISFVCGIGVFSSSIFRVFVRLF